jgi:hypothetical protein
VRGFFDDLCQYIIVDIDPYTFDGICQLQRDTLIFFQDIPILIVQILIINGVLNCEQLLEDGSLTFYISLASTIANLVTYIFLKILRMRATKENFVMLTLEGMTANTTWLPYYQRLQKNENDEIHMGIM